MLYADDLEPGRRFGFETHAVDEAEIVRFARERDPQPMHLDGAAPGPFGGLIASGVHTIAILQRLHVAALLDTGGRTSLTTNGAFLAQQRP